MQSPDQSLVRRKDPISFDTNGLYILLSDIGYERQFHWGFYLATGPEQGHVYHLVNNVDTGYEWKYKHGFTTNVPFSITLLAAVKIGVMDALLHNPLGERLKAVSQAQPITCRTWLMRALYDLDDEGYIKLIGKLDEIEIDAELKAVENKARKITTVEKSMFSAA